MIKRFKGAPALVTGATGFVGGRLWRVLQAQGFRVRVLTRRDTGLEELVTAGVEVAHGDLRDHAAVERATRDQRLVFHCAGRVSDWGPRTAFIEANVNGTANVIAACVENKVERLVHLSSLTVLGLPRHAREVDETTPYADPPIGDFYTQSKIAGEKLVRAANGEHGLTTTVIRPGAIWGPGDVIIVPRILRLMRRGLMPIVGSGNNVLGLSHVDNLVVGMILAAETDAAAGQVYHITDGEIVVARDALEEVARAYGLAAPRLRVPFWAVHSFAATVEGLAKAFGRTTPPPITRYGVRFVACDCRYDIRKARRELGYEPRVSFRKGIAELARGSEARGNGVDATHG